MFVHDPFELNLHLGQTFVQMFLSTGGPPSGSAPDPDCRTVEGLCDPTTQPSSRGTFMPRCCWLMETSGTSGCHK